MKKYFYVLMAVIAIGSMGCSKVDDSYVLQGTWASYADKTGQIADDSKGEFLVWTFYRDRIYQECIQGLYETGVIYGIQDAKNAKNDITYDYTYQGQKLSYNKVEVPVTVKDDDHIIIDGSTHWTRLKGMKTPVYFDSNQIDLSKYEADGDSACWQLSKKSNSKIEVTYLWANEYNVASEAISTIKTAQAQGKEIACFWTKVNSDTKDACKKLNAK